MDDLNQTQRATSSIEMHLSKALEFLRHLEPMDLTERERVLARIYIVQIEDEIKRLARGNV